MARFYGQNIEMLHKKCHVDIHPCYTEYIHVMCIKRCSMQLYTNERCSIKLKAVPRQKVSSCCLEEPPISFSLTAYVMRAEISAAYHSYEPPRHYISCINLAL